MPKRHRGEDRQKMLEDQYVNTIERMEEAEETLKYDDIPEDQQDKIKEKNRHRKENLQGLQSELDGGSNEFHER